MSQEKIDVDSIFKDAVEKLGDVFEVLNSDERIKENFNIQIEKAKTELSQKQVDSGAQAEKLEFYKLFYLGFLGQMIGDLSGSGKYERGLWRAFRSGVFSFFGSDPTEELMEMQISPSSSFEEKVNSFVPLLERIKDKISFSIEDGAVAIKVEGSKYDFKTILEKIGTHYMGIPNQEVKNTLPDTMAPQVTSTEPTIENKDVPEAVIREEKNQDTQIVVANDELEPNPQENQDETDETDETEIVLSDESIIVGVMRSLEIEKIDAMLNREIEKLEYLKKFESQKINASVDAQIGKAKTQVKKELTETDLDEVRGEFYKSFYSEFLQAMINDLLGYEEGTLAQAWNRAFSFSFSFLVGEEEPYNKLKNTKFSGSFEKDLEIFIPLLRDIKSNISVEEGGSVGIEGSDKSIEEIMGEVIECYKKISFKDPRSILSQGQVSRQGISIIENKNKVKLALIEHPEDVIGKNQSQNKPTKVVGEKVKKIDQDLNVVEKDEEDRDTQTKPQGKANEPLGPRTQLDETLSSDDEPETDVVAVEKSSKCKTKAESGQESKADIKQQVTGTSPISAVAEEMIRSIDDALISFCAIRTEEMVKEYPDMKPAIGDGREAGYKPYTDVNFLKTDHRMQILSTIKEELTNLKDNNYKDSKEKTDQRAFALDCIKVIEKNVTPQNLKEFTKLSSNPICTWFRSIIETLYALIEKTFSKPHSTYKPQLFADNLETRVAEIAEKAHNDFIKLADELLSDITSKGMTIN